ncbi:uncharacterized protein BP01DRAFT_76333 [Aspergillus saccharolyticus JOP 1030-1]|uniref:Uncharacterized protein n=1 Tax=Aspergillus saccharolyticus JOP 1030-1 TaxID=1450539 RepID=A0A318ZQR2_9EURO|nr:hypothetical protein BP01DRAFT_76333 [Aspergillus saccharolyticus JOP 1030-1]PYH49397.1 hypothetical protein BP01DRAFT_76333 [Aspergillus saccharolyticus JOP 1030-1]
MQSTGPIRSRASLTPATGVRLKTFVGNVYLLFLAPLMIGVALRRPERPRSLTGLERDFSPLGIPCPSFQRCETHEIPSICSELLLCLSIPAETQPMETMQFVMGLTA